MRMLTGSVWSRLEPCRAPVTTSARAFGMSPARAYTKCPARFTKNSIDLIVKKSEGYPYDRMTSR